MKSVRLICAFGIVGICFGRTPIIIPSVPHLFHRSSTQQQIRSFGSWLVLRGGGEESVKEIDEHDPENHNETDNAALGDFTQMKKEISDIHATTENDSWLKEQEQKLKSEVGPDGNPLSKNELKRRLKLLRLEKEKAEKKAKAAENQPAKEQPDEDDVDPRLYFENRCALVAELRKNGTAYPHRYDVSLSIPSFRAKYEGIFAPGEKEPDGREESIAGRIASTRQQGRLIFYELRGDGARVQVHLRAGHQRKHIPSHD